MAQNLPEVKFFDVFLSCSSEIREMSCADRSYGTSWFRCKLLTFTCAANFQEQPKSYAPAVEHTLKNEKSTRAALFSEIVQEQSLKESKKFNPVIKGTKPSDVTTDEAIVQDLAIALSVPVNRNDVSTKRIVRIQEHTGQQFPLVIFKGVINKKKCFSKLWKIAQ